MTSESRSRKSVFSKNVLIYFFGGVLAAGANFLLAPVYIRVLSDYDFGIWSKFLLFQQLSQIIMSWGMMAAMMRLLVGVSKSELRILIRSAIFSCILLNSILVISIYILGSLFNLEEIIGTENTYIIFSALISSFFFSFVSILMGFYIATSQAIKYRAISIISFMLQFSLIISFSSFNEVSFREAVSLAVVGVFLLSSFCIINLFRVSGFKFSLKKSKKLLLFSLPLIVYTLVTQGYDMAVRFSLMSLITEENFGIFSAVLLYASVPAMVSSAINLSWTPIFFKNADKWINDNTYNKFFITSCSLIAIICLFQIIFWQDLLTIYFGYLPDVNFIFISCLCISSWIGSTVWTGLSNPIFEKGHTKEIMIFSIKSLILLSPFAFYLILNFLTLGTSISLLMYSLILCFFSYSYLKSIGIDNLPILNIFKILILISVIVLANWYLPNNFNSYIYLYKTILIMLCVIILLKPIYKDFFNLLKIIDEKA